MAYFNHAFCKSFLANSAGATDGDPITTLTEGQVTLVDDADWTIHSSGAISSNSLTYIVQGSYRSDILGGNSNHGGYGESIKSKGINPKYLTRIWESECINATAAQTSVTVGPKCHPCGENLMLRVDVKGSPALRFLNRNAYAIGDSMGDSAAGDVPGLCCVAGQTYLDPAVALAKIGKMIVADPIVSPFLQEKAGGGIVITGASNAGTFTFDEVLTGAGGFTALTDPVGDGGSTSGYTSVTITFEGAYVSTTFGTSSFDSRDFYGKEPVQLISSMIDETGEPCNDCGTVVNTPAVMEQTTGETVLRHLLLSERYMQNPVHQGNTDFNRMREIEGSEAIIKAVDLAALYKTYYVQHSVPRFNNPTSTFDNDQYVYEIFVKCTDTNTQSQIEALLTLLATAAGITKETAIDQQP